MKTKVLHIINSLMIGGAEVLLANSLSLKGLNEYTDNYIAYFKEGDYLQSKIDKNVKQICLNYKGGFDIIRMLRQLQRIILENKIDIIHTHLTPASFYVNLIKPKKIPQIHTVHIAYSTDFETRPILKYLERKILFEKNKCNLIFLSEFTKADFLHTIKFKGRSYVLNNFVDDVFFSCSTKKYYGSSQRDLKMIAVGNLRPQKNYSYLLEIFKHLKEYNIHLDIYGGGEMEKYKQIINDNHLNVTLKGPEKNIELIIGQYDLFIMSSTNEGFPLSVFEAMASGLPLMLSDIAPLKSIVKEHAIYFELDNAQKVAQQLIAILHGKIDINDMAVKARNYAEKTVRREIYIKNLLKIYKQLH